MALTYSLRYKKLNFYQKVVLEKEGEIIIDRNSFRLKGKGAQDLGENIFFGDIKDLIIKDDYLAITTYAKDKYVLSNFSNLFDSFLKDFIRVRNDYLADNLFMKVGMLIKEFEGNVEITNSYEKTINKGRSRIQFYEGSVVVLPEIKEAVVIYYSFLKHHEFDEDDFVLRLNLENGNTITISKLGTQYEDVQDTMESIMGKMYEKIVNYLSGFFTELPADDLVKLAYKIKDGRAVQYSSLKKINDDLPERMETLAFEENEVLKEKARALRSHTDNQNFYFGFSFIKVDTYEVRVQSWFLCAIPEKNIIAIGVNSGPESKAVYFFRIIMQQGSALEKLSAKILEVEQSMVLFRNDLTPIIKDRRDLRKTKYRIPIKKLSFLRLLRKSFIGISRHDDMKDFKKDIEIAVEKASLEK